MPFVLFRKRLRFCALLFALSLLPVISSAYEGDLVYSQLPLDAVLREVAITNPRILEAVKVYDSVKEELKSAKSGYRPNLSTSMSVGQEVTDGASYNNVRKDLTASTASLYAKQNIFNGFGTDNFVDETKARAMSAAYQALDTANTVFEETIEAYLNVLKEQALLNLEEKNVYIQAQILDQIKQKTESGFGRQSDLLNAQARLALARANFISQQQNLKQAAVRLHKYLGRFADPRQLEEPEMNFEFPDNVEEVVDIAFNNYPALEVARYNVVAKKYTMKRTGSRYFPTLDAELRADYSNNTGGDEGDSTSYSAMLKMNYDIYDGGKRSADRSKNYADILKENERSYIERRNLNEAVRLAWNIKIAEDKKFSYLKENEDLSEKTMDAFKEEYQLGRRTLLELLDMENQLEAAKKALEESRFATMLSYFRVMHVTGMLLYEYETNLYKAVDINKRKFDLNLLNKYGNINDNRDADNVKDSADQCDNSIFNSDTDTFGCANDENVSVGYLKPQKVEPYIKPKGQESLGGEQQQGLGDPQTGGLGEPQSLGEPQGLGEPQSLGEPQPSDSLGEPQKTPDAPAADEVKPEPEAKAAEPEKAQSGGVMKIDKGTADQSFNFSNIQFELNSSRLTTKSAKMLDKIAEELKNAGDFTLDIVGHTDNSGRASFNLKLSAERAQSVYDRLAEAGVPAEKMKAYGRGEAEPLYSNKYRSGRIKNRRIEFKLHRIKQQE